MNAKKVQFMRKKVKYAQRRCNAPGGGKVHAEKVLACAKARACGEGAT